MNMYEWVDSVIGSETKKPLPVLSFPSIQKIGVGVSTLLSDSDLQARGIKTIADSFDTSASVSYMDLSVEAEAFGSTIRFSGQLPPLKLSVLKRRLVTALWS